MCGWYGYCNTISAVVINTVPDILVTVVTKGYVHVVNFASKVTSVNWLLWLCEHTRIVFLCRISYLVSAYTYFLTETI